MKKLSRLFAALLAAVLTLTMVSATTTTYEEMDDAIYFSSASIPEDATAYVLSMFSQLNVTVLTSLGFTEEEACNLKISHGICANIIGSNADDIIIYYYPVLCDNEILAMITLTWYNDQYNFQFSRSSMAKALNNIETTSSNPARVYVSSDAYYCVVNGEVTVLTTVVDADLSKIESEVIALSEDSIVSSLTNASEVTVVIGSEYSLDVGDYINDTTVDLTGVIRDVTCVPNYSVTDSTGTHGICWAASSAAIIDYYVNGCATVNAIFIREDILQDRLDTHGDKTGTIYTIKSYIQSLTGKTMKITGSMLSWSQVKTAILTNNAPCCMIWEDTTGEKSNHAMVLCGYYYAVSAPSDSNYYWIKMMNPNEESYAFMPFSSSLTYTVANNPYSWTDSVIRS